MEKRNQGNTPATSVAPGATPRPAACFSDTPTSVTCPLGGTTDAGGVRKQLFSFDPKAPPLLVVLGATGAGKSTLLNRLTHPLSEQRQQLFKEGEGAESETRMPIERQAHFFGNPDDPINLVDMPGLDDSGGAAVDTQNIRNAAKFLMERREPFAHLFVLVVNAASPRLSNSVRNMMTTFRKVFDDDGRKGFVDYLAVVFTKVNFVEFMFPKGDVFAAPATKADFDAAKDRKFKALTDTWAAQLCDLLGHGGDEAKIAGLQSRFVLTDSTLAPGMMDRLATPYELHVNDDLGQLLSMARHKGHFPFPLAYIDASAMSVQQELEAERAEQERRAKETAAKAEEERIAHEKDMKDAREQAARDKKKAEEEAAAKLRETTARHDKVVREMQASREEQQKQHAELLAATRRAGGCGGGGRPCMMEGPPGGQQQPQVLPQQQQAVHHRGTAIGVHQSSGSANGRTLYEGARGGRFYMSANGNKVYTKRK